MYCWGMYDFPFWNFELLRKSSDRNESTWEFEHTYTVCTYNYIAAEASATAL